VHPLVNTATVQVTPAHLKTFIAKFGQKVEVLDLAALVAVADAEAPAAVKKKKKKEVSSMAQLGITAKKDTQFHDWYTQVVVCSELIEYYDISGCCQ
jgi:ribosomal protein L12E/L44/L45/RPP1/RPP2